MTPDDRPDPQPGPAAGGGTGPRVTFEDFVDPVDGTRWSVDIGFLASRWRCIWDAGCQGIEDEPAPARGLGCCSVGAELLDDDEAMTVAALATTLSPELFQFADAARGAAGGVLTPDRRGTRVVDGACILLNRPGFAGGAGCALHLGAVADGDDPIDWKPSVCWQLPLKVDQVDGGKRLRRWGRADWGSGGATMAWCCPDEPEPYVADGPVIETLATEVAALVGPEVAVAIRDRVAARG